MTVQELKDLDYRSYNASDGIFEYMLTKSYLLPLNEEDSKINLEFKVTIFYGDIYDKVKLHILYIPSIVDGEYILSACVIVGGLTIHDNNVEKIIEYLQIVK